MRLPRPRFTLRRMMVAVAIAAILLGVSHWMERRATSFRALRDFHANRWSLTIVQPRGDEGRMNGTLQVTGYGGRAVDGLRARGELWNFQMFRKYEWAARHPWLPVEPDPPEPGEASR